jgi:two-component system, OmpR family, KDP operon response regulator KdpE
MAILVLSAVGERAKIDALESGADDCMTKPFGIAEFMARLRVALRVTRRSEEPAVVRTADFTLDLAAKRAPAWDRGSSPDRHRMADPGAPGR